jgi:hypothetical protein
LTPSRFASVLKEKQEQFYQDNSHWPTLMVVSWETWQMFMDSSVTSLSWELISSPTDAVRIKAEAMKVVLADVGDEVFVGREK